MGAYGIHPTRYGNLSNDQLYAMFRESVYSNLGENEKLDLLQETVNRDALEKGEVGSPEVRFADLPANESGNAANGVINVNQDMAVNGVQSFEYNGQTIQHVVSDYNVRSLNTDGCIIRTAVNIQLDEESILLYEVVRSTPHAMRKLADKVSRYYTLINDSRYREDNYYGYAAVPQLVICGESYEHCVKIDQYLRSRGLISETDSLLYTEDLFYVQQTLQTLYELDEAGNRAWYSLPEREMVTDMERSA